MKLCIMSFYLEVTAVGLQSCVLPPRHELFRDVDLNIPVSGIYTGGSSGNRRSSVFELIFNSSPPLSLVLAELQVNLS